MGDVGTAFGLWESARRTLAALVLTVAAFATIATADVRADEYVSLGDSYVAGPFIPNPVLPLGCLKSSNNYPRLAAPGIGHTLRDASCSGAKTTHMSQPQNVDPDGPNPPQFDRLDSSTAVVSVTIGGNDIGFSEIAQGCITANPFSSPCRDRYLAGGRDEISDRINATAPLVDQVLDVIRSRASQADMFVVDYPAIFPETGNGCWPRVPISYSDAPYLRAKQRELNEMLATQAGANGATLVSWYQASIGHDSCKGSSTRWVEPLVPGSSAAPIHPNRRGMEGAADVLSAAAGG
ncbi:MAG: SGNH/GDSL hydrolase family protein [Solirubrobacterales bacterium]